MALPNVSGEALVVQEPELKFSPNGDANVSLRVKASSRKLNQQTQQWEDGESTFLNLNVWRGAAENICEQIMKMRAANIPPVVTYAGQLHVREYEKRDGGKGISVDVKIQSIGMTVSSQVTARPQGQQQGQQQPQGAPYGQPQGQPAYGQQGAPQGQPYAQPQGQPQYGQPQGQPQYAPQPGVPAADPWATPGQSQPPF